MNKPYLNEFDQRIEHIGLYAILIEHIASKSVFDKYELSDFSKQINLVFSTLLYVMEKTLRVEVCTKDDLQEFIHETHWALTNVQLTYDQEVELVELIVEDILCNNGSIMNIEGFQYETNTYRSIAIKYLDTKRVDTNGHTRVTYSLTEQGYTLMLSTKEIESNMKLNVQELIFNLHMERMEFDKAVEDIKNMYITMRSQLLKIDHAKQQMRRNVMAYGFDNYQKLIDENNETKEEMFKKLVAHKDRVQAQIKEIESHDPTKDQDTYLEQINHLSKIIEYLDLSIDEHLAIFNAHTNIKMLYTEELDKMSQLELIHCFSLNHELYEPLMNKPSSLTRLQYFFHPLFQKELPKSYNINKAITYQMKQDRELEEEIMHEEIDFEECMRLEQERIDQAKKRLEFYKQSLIVLLEHIKDGMILSDLIKQLNEDEKDQFIPCVSIFKEEMIQLLIKETINMEQYEDLTKDFANSTTIEFNLEPMLKEIMEELPYLSFETLSIEPLEQNDIITIEHVYDDYDNTYKDVTCTDLAFHIQKQGGL